MTIQDRLRFVIYADEQFAANLSSEDLDFVQTFRVLERFERERNWRSLPDEATVDTIRASHQPQIEKLCQIIAESEVRIYNRRAGALRHSHPLAIQVNLETGVANGVLVVRKIEDCARLLRSILTNSMEFELQDDEKAKMWWLREKISGCAFRVVSKDRKLTNCFWNFYRRSQA